MNNDLSQKYRDEMMRYYNMQKKNRNCTSNADSENVHSSFPKDIHSSGINMNTVPFPDEIEETKKQQDICASDILPNEHCNESSRISEEMPVSVAEKQDYTQLPPDDIREYHLHDHAKTDNMTQKYCGDRDIYAQEADCIAFQNESDRNMSPKAYDDCAIASESYDDRNISSKAHDNCATASELYDNRNISPKAYDDRTSFPNIYDGDTVENRVVPHRSSTIYGQPETYNNIPASAENTSYDDFSAPVSERYPDPDIPEYIHSAENSTSGDAEYGTGMKSYGKLRIEASSGDHADPVEDALIIVTRINGNEKNIIGILLTDSSGETQTLEISAPERELSETPTDKAVSTQVDIIAYKKGYYEFENRNVPIFAGVTSIQSVNMIPLPLNSPEKRMVFTEERPNL